MTRQFTIKRYPIKLRNRAPRDAVAASIFMREAYARRRSLPFSAFTASPASVAKFGREIDVVGEVA